MNLFEQSLKVKLNCINLNFSQSAKLFNNIGTTRLSLFPGFSTSRETGNFQKTSRESQEVKNFPGNGNTPKKSSYKYPGKREVQKPQISQEIYWEKTLNTTI